MTVKTISLAPMVNPHFNFLWDDYQDFVLNGGRGGTKSSAISICIVSRFLADPLADAVIFRKTGANVGRSVYQQIRWAINEMIKVRPELEGRFKFPNSPLPNSPAIIQDKVTGTGFYFYGVDDPDKIKSIKPSVSHFGQVWFEELTEFGSWDEVDAVRASFIRAKLPDDRKVITYYSYNPPKNPYDWINEWLDTRIGKENWYIDKSTYLDDVRGFLSEQYIQEINTVKKNDYEYYRWMYLGEVVGYGSNIFNMDLVHPLNDLWRDDPIVDIMFSIDVGHQISATTCQAFAITAKGNVVLLDTYYYSPVSKSVKKAPTDFVNDIDAFIREVSKTYPNAKVTNVTVDSAEGALRNQFYHDRGLSLHPVAKLKKETMIDMVQDLLSQGRFFYLDIENNGVFVKEMKNYRYDEKTLNTPEPRVVKIDDHTADSFQYFVVDNARRLGLKR